MQKVGIVTLSGYFNYGNKLQNYALEQYLMNHHLDVETLYHEDVYEHTVLGKIFQKIKNRSLVSSIKNKFTHNLDTNYVPTQVLNKKNIKFRDFSYKYLHERNYDLSNRNLKNIEFSEFSTFFVGSDQVWNLDINNFHEKYFLTFIEQRKRNSFAASFGFSSFANFKTQVKYIKYLETMNNISVREVEGQKLVDDFTKKKATLLLDPTMLLSQQEWREIESKPKVTLPNKYLLTYFLGEVSKEYIDFIKKVSLEMNLSIIELNNPEYMELFSVDPSEFIYLFDNASFVFTDSFHGTVFSLVFHKSFNVVPRIDKNMVNMSSRITTILSRFKLEEQYVSNPTQLEDLDYLKELDFTSFEKESLINQDSADAFLKVCLDDVK